MVGLKLWLDYRFGGLLRKEDGAAAVEYGLLVGLIAVAIILTVMLLGNQLNALFTTVTDNLTDVSGLPGAGGGGD